jgi:hypothetical protein
MDGELGLDLIRFSNFSPFKEPGVPIVRSTRRLQIVIERIDFPAALP